MRFPRNDNEMKPITTIDSFDIDKIVADSRAAEAQLWQTNPSPAPVRAVDSEPARTDDGDFDVDKIIADSKRREADMWRSDQSAHVVNRGRVFGREQFAYVRSGG